LSPPSRAGGQHMSSYKRRKSPVQSLKCSREAHAQSHTIKNTFSHLHSHILSHTHPGTFTHLH
jgi:hypothetical protein